MSSVVAEVDARGLMVRAGGTTHRYNAATVLWTAGEVAMQSGYYAGRLLRADLTGGARSRPFRYRDLGSAAYISRGNAVVSMGRLYATGRLGWLAWLFIHIAFLTTFRNRLGAILTWALSFSRETRRERAFSLQKLDVGRNVYDVAGEPRRQSGPDRPR